MNKEKIDIFINKITKGGDDFILSKWSMIVFLGTIVVFGVFNFLLFGLGITDVKTPFIDADITSTNYAYIGWTSLSLSLVGSLFNIWGFILITRMSKNFIVPILIGGVLSIPNEIFVGAIFSGICFTILIGAEIMTWFKWRNADSNHGIHNTATKKHYIALAALWVVFVTIGLTVSFTVDFFLDEGTFVPVMDVLGSSVVLICWTLALMKNRWALLVLVANDSVYVLLYIFLGVYAMGVTFLIYMSMNFIGFLGWSSKQKEDNSLKDKNFTKK